jgi:hypothetical protein
MAAGSGVQIDGLRELVRNLERLGTETDDLKAAFRKVGTLVVNEAKSLTPRLSGSLADSIRPSNSKNKAVVRAGSARVPYAAPIHFGWQRRNIAPSYFLFDAIDATAGESVEVLNTELRGVIRRLGL